MQRETFQTLARASWSMFLLAICLNVISFPLDHRTRFYVALVGMGIYALAFLFGVVAMISTFFYGARGIFGHAFAGILLNGMVLVAMGTILLLIFQAPPRAPVAATLPPRPAVPAARFDPPARPVVAPPRPVQPPIEVPPVPQVEPPTVAPPEPAPVIAKAPSPLDAKEVEMRVGDQWLRATVTFRNAEGAFLKAQSTDPAKPAAVEFVPNERIRSLDTQTTWDKLVTKPTPTTRPTAATRPATIRTTKVAPPSSPPPVASRYHVGQQVDVHWGSKWWPSTVLKVEPARTYIKYDGWSDSFNEWVTPDRIRPR